MDKLSSLEGVPKVIVSGVMRDVSKKESKDKFSVLSTSFHGGFILMNNLGNTLKDDEVKQLDDDTKKTVAETFHKMHELDVFQGDVRVDNIVLTPEGNTEAARTGRQYAYIIDFGNAVITKDEALKTEGKWDVEDLLGYS